MISSIRIQTVLEHDIVADDLHQFRREGRREQAELQLRAGLRAQGVQQVDQAAEVGLILAGAAALRFVAAGRGLRRFAGARLGEFEHLADIQGLSGHQDGCVVGVFRANEPNDTAVRQGEQQVAVVRGDVRFEDRRVVAEIVGPPVLHRHDAAGTDRNDRLAQQTAVAERTDIVGLVHVAAVAIQARVHKADINRRFGAGPRGGAGPSGFRAGRIALADLDLDAMLDARFLGHCPCLLLGAGRAEDTPGGPQN